MLFNDVNFEIKLLKTHHLHLLKPKFMFYKICKKTKHENVCNKNKLNYI